MKKKHLLQGAVMVAAASLLLTACSSNNNGGDDNKGETPQETITLRVGHVNPPEAIDAIIVEEVAKNINERSGGSLKLEVYPAGQIGTTGDTAEQAANGENVIGYMDPSIIAQLGGTDYGILGGPFVFGDLDEVNNFLDSDLFVEMTDKVADEQGIRILSAGWVDGPRHIFAKKPVPEPSDLAGMKFRTPPVDLWTTTFSLLGAVPTEVNITEVYGALEQGVVDAVEGPINGTYANRFHEIVNQVTLTGHFRTLLGYGMSEKVWQSLSAEQQEIVLDEFVKGGLKAQQEYAAAIEDTMAKMTAESGAEFHEANLDAYRKMTAPFFDSYGDLFDKVREAATKG